MKKNISLALFVLVSIGVASLGCDKPQERVDEVTKQSEAKPAPRRLNIVATIGMIADVVKNVGGDRINLQMLMGEGVDPHLYKPTRSDIAKLSAADIVFYNGLLLEGKLVDALIRVATSGTKVYPVTELLDEKFLLEPKEFQGHYDPHVWMDPSAWLETINVVRDKLIENDPANTDVYMANAVGYETKLKNLDQYAKKILTTVPDDSRVVVTAHDAFNYFGRRYGFEVVGIQGLSTESEAGVQDIERIVNLLVERKIKAVFVETTVADRNVKALIAGASAKGHPVVIGGKLFSDAMGKRGSYEGTYEGMIDHNVSTIALALGGDVPERGLNGQLASLAK